MKISFATPSPGVGIGSSTAPANTNRVKLAVNNGLLFLTLLICALAIVFMGANYASLFQTNGSLTYAMVTSAISLGAALVFKSTRRMARLWPIAYALFIACIINLVSIVFAPYIEDIVRWLGVSGDTNAVLGLDKVYDMLLVVVPVFALTFVAREDLGSLLLKKGNSAHWWGWGIGALILVNYFTSVLMFYGTTYTLPALGSATIWGLVFAFANSMLEELWVRGIFFQKLLPLVGSVGTILLTTTVFAALHFHSVVFMPAFAVPIFVINTFTLGLALGILTLKTNSLWGAILMHAAADLFLFIAMLAAH
jgi:membrane protease YdiL (CAAX protease family)